MPKLGAALLVEEVNKKLWDESLALGPGPSSFSLFKWGHWIK